MYCLSCFAPLGAQEGYVCPCKGIRMLLVSSARKLTRQLTVRMVGLNPPRTAAYDSICRVRDVMGRVCNVKVLCNGG